MFTIQVKSHKKINKFRNDNIHRPNATPSQENETTESMKKNIVK